MNIKTIKLLTAEGVGWIHKGAILEFDSANNKSKLKMVGSDFMMFGDDYVTMVHPLTLHISNQSENQLDNFDMDCKFKLLSIDDREITIVPLLSTIKLDEVGLIG